MAECKDCEFYIVQYDLDVNGEQYPYPVMFCRKRNRRTDAHDQMCRDMEMSLVRKVLKGTSIERIKKELGDGNAKGR